MYVKRYVPVSLTTLRLLLGPVAVAFAYEGFPRWMFAPILVVGTLSDIYDGILARKFSVSTTALRRYDSATDIIYDLCLLASCLALLAFDFGGWCVRVLAMIGVACNAEIIAILCLATKPPVDVRSILCRPGSTAS